MQEQYPCNLSEEQISEFRRKYGKLYVVTVTDGDESFEAVCCEQTTKTAQICSDLLKKGDEAGATAACYNNVVLAADEQIKQRDPLKIKVIQALNEEITKITATAKKL